MLGHRVVKAARQCRSFSVAAVTVNGKKYAVPKKPIVGICLDGSAQDYIDAASQDGCMPNFNRILTRKESKGSHGLVASLVPTFTNPNNVGIMTGVTCKEHGICGNYFYDEASGEEVMMNDVKYLRADSIFAALNKQANTHVTVITAKDKLLRLLSSSLDTSASLAFSVEKANETKTTELLKANGVEDLTKLMGRAPPGIYDPDNSIYALELGAKLLRQRLISSSASASPSLSYLSTTDYVQHKHSPGSKEANDFYAKVDAVIGALDELGATVALTADHGMNDKTKFDGQPKVVYAETVLKQHGFNPRVILPITDPYVVHHGSLGSYATIYLAPAEKDRIHEAMTLLRKIPGVYTVVNKEEAVKNFDLPGDRIGDIVMTGDRNTVIGKSESHHDLSSVPHLRSHGGIDEVMVPFFINRPLKPEFSRQLTTGKARNFHLFDYLCNGVSH